MTAWITRFDQPAEPGLVGDDGLVRGASPVGGAGLVGGAGPVRVAVKDAIDMAGVITTAGCAAVRDRAVPATSDARCLASFRVPGVHIVGKTTLTELCVSPVGDNATFGMPTNPVAPDRIPGGSSSGSAVAVAGGEADIGLGTDTGGSVRIPAACCGIVGLKTTWGRIPVTGVWPLSPSLDTVGPLARDVAGVVTGMRLLEPGFTVAARPARLVGRLRIDGVDPAVEDAVDAALEAARVRVREMRLPGWDATFDPFGTILQAELWRANRTLLDAEGVGAFVNDGLHAGREISAARLAEAMASRAAWRSEVAAALDEVDVLALPTLSAPPPLASDFAGSPLTWLTSPFNLAGVPALAMPVPSPGFPVPFSLQLAGSLGGEDLLCATGLAIERVLP